MQFWCLSKLGWWIEFSVGKVGGVTGKKHVKFESDYNTREGDSKSYARVGQHLLVSLFPPFPTARVCEWWALFYYHHLFPNYFTSSPSLIACKPPLTTTKSKARHSSTKHFFFFLTHLSSFQDAILLKTSSNIN